MNATNLQELIAEGEHSSLEFKRDCGLTSEKLGRELVALANLKGGHLLIGVEDDGSISGLQRQDLEEWVMTICRQKIYPPLLPGFQVVTVPPDSRQVAVIEVPPAPIKPCRLLESGHRNAYIRVGSTVREPGEEELAQMYQASLRLDYGKIPVVEASFEDLEYVRIRNFLEVGLQYPPAHHEEELRQTMRNLEWLAESPKGLVPTVYGVLLFATQPRRFLPQAGIRAIAHPGLSESLETIEDTVLDAPMVPERTREGRDLSPGLIERAIHFVNRHAPPRNPLEGVRHLHNSAFPEDVLRELLTNAIAHRDYTNAGADILLNLFPDRLEITSPGRLPNGCTVEAILGGLRHHRNPALVQTLRDLRYMDARGMGLRLRVVPEVLRRTGRPPVFTATDHSFTVSIPKMV